jgi:limonene-1,2-epoxide hydrolase
VGYVNPFETDDEIRENHGVLSRRQAQKDHAAAMQENGIDAAIHRSKSSRFRVPEGFKKIPGASRSGALDPQTRARLEHDEAEGLIEVARDVHGKALGYREIEK